jgi:hypothetical protein
MAGNLLLGGQAMFSVYRPSQIHDGVDITFATGDGRTATVVGGIITDVS